MARRPEPYSHPDWLFEVKWDGFRSLAYIENGHCRLVSRNRNEFKSLPALNSALPRECRAKRAVLDGEIVCLDRKGNSQLRRLNISPRNIPARVWDDSETCKVRGVRYAKKRICEKQYYAPGFSG